MSCAAWFARTRPSPNPGAGLAADLRAQVRQQLIAGKSDDQIKQYMVARYGDFVLFKPPWQPNTWLLWGGPLLLLGIGALVVLIGGAPQGTACRYSPAEDTGDDPRCLTPVYTENSQHDFHRNCSLHAFGGRRLLAVPLWRRRKTGDAANAAELKEHKRKLATLERQLKKGELRMPEYMQARKQLEDALQQKLTHRL